MANNESRHQPGLWGAPDDEADSHPSPTTRRHRPSVTGRPRPATPMEFSELWSVEEVANYLGVPKQTVYCWRTSGYGPQGFRVGKHLRWRAATVIAWTLQMEREQ